MKAKVYDANGNNNGRLDPGETANLTVFVKNIGGVNFTDLSTTLQSSDPFVTIMDNSGHFGELMVDSTKENISDPYIVSVSASCPQGHNASFRVIASDGAFVDTFEFIGSCHYLVWNLDPLLSSGQAINSTLASLGYTGVYSTTLSTVSDLSLYRSIFICCGVHPNNYRIGAASPEATALVNYLNNGGRVCLEGGDVWYYDPLAGGYNFGSLFGIQGISDGTGDMGPVVGQSGTFTQGMNFDYAGENSYMDHIAPTTGFLIFADGNNAYNCGVARTTGTYRTIGTSFELGGLVDGTAPSTKTVLLDSIMHFFGSFLPSVEENNQSIIANKPLRLYPNPVKLGDGVRIQFTPKTNGKVGLKIYNTVGTCVKTMLVDNNSHSIIWNGTNENGLKVPAGVYFVDVNLDNKISIERVVLIN